MLRLIVYSFIVSSLLCYLIVALFNKGLLGFSSDILNGPQKYHKNPTPRIGGVGVFIGFLVSEVFYYVNYKSDIIIFIALSVFIVFVSGLIEDFTKKVPPKVRLLAAFLSAAVAVFLLKIYISRIGLPLIDKVFEIKIIAIAFTVFAVAGVTNSINIIDGYNGLSSIVGSMILLAIAYVAYKVGNRDVMDGSFAGVGAIMGFFLWNYPFGKIFLGDGGAYFIGFLIAVLSVLLIYNNSQVSPWFPLLASIYPVWEVIFSIFRRKKKSKSADEPDRHHLHQLVYKRIVPKLYHLSKNDTLKRNSTTSPFLWLICSAGVIPAMLLWNNTYILILCTVIFCVVYVLFYDSIVRFKL